MKYRLRMTLFTGMALGLILLALPASLDAQSSKSTGAGKLNGDEILQLSDRSRNGWDSYFVRTTIQNYEDNTLKEEGLFDVNIKGADKTLVRFLNADVKGQYLLMVNDDMWIYMPSTRKPIRITPLQRLMGDASNGDVARTRYADDYAATLKGEETIGGSLCYILELIAKRDGATYKRIDYWVTKETKRPMKAEIYLISGKHYKSIEFDKYEETQDRVLLTQMTIVDRLREGRTTIMKYSSYAPKELPEKYFNKDYLEKLR
jgi:outer membrane lipoprotein-sorting protein